MLNDAELDSFWGATPMHIIRCGVAPTSTSEIPNTTYAMSLQVLRFILSKETKNFLPASYLAYHKTRNYAQSRNEESKSLSSSREQVEITTDVKPLGEKIKENTKTASYMGVILLGVGVTGIMFYAIFRELFSSSSSNNVYSKALKQVINDPRVQDALGAPIKGFGEESRRRRRQHVAHTVFQRNGVNHMRMQFYIQGVRNKATVHLEMKENPSGKYEYRYLFVQLDYFPRTTIILEDNRLNDARPLNDQNVNSSELKPIM